MSWGAVLFVIALSVVGGADAASGARILRLRHFSGPEHTRIVLDLDRASSFEVRRVEGPDRIALNLPGAVFAAGGDRKVGDGLVERIRCNVGADRAQIVIDLAGRREFRAFSLPPSGGKPDRIVIDILRAGGTPPPIVEPGAEPAAIGLADADDAAPSTTPSRDIRVAAAAREVPLVEGDTVAVDPVAEAEAAVAAKQDSTTAGIARDAAAVAQIAMSQDAPTEEVLPGEPPVEAEDADERTVAARAGQVDPDDPFVVVVDPGHGGDDPGAVRGSLLEKDICLDIAREVARQLGKLPGYRVVMTRDRDKTLALGKRVEIARREKGDVFLSIHCNTHPRPAVSGMEVYFLSLQGATDREARELADKENAAGLVGLPPGGEHADLVVDILMDLKMTRVLQDSGRLAAAVLTAADRSGAVAGRRVKQAGFQVLKTLAMPSALVEVAYLSNPDDYRLLSNPAGRRRLAGAIVMGLEDWRAGTAPVNSKTSPVVAMRTGGESWETVYKVRRGDSLWKLADRYGTTMNEIARRNNLSERERELRIGQRLRLPKVGAQP
jgi:N-acetylmuramoyl-L-alanine amidase